VKFKVNNLQSNCIRHLVCTVAVNGLNNFQVGFLTALPTAGDPVATTSYTVCKMEMVGVTVGAEVTVTCDAPSDQQYVIIQSIDTSAEKLCIAEACVNAPSQYAVTFVSIRCSNNAAHNAFLIYVRLPLACA